MKKILGIYILGMCSIQMVQAQAANPGSEVLLVIDMQEEFTLYQMDSLLSHQMISQVNDLIGEMRPAAIIFIQAHIRVLNISLRGIKAESAQHLDLDNRLYRKKNDLVFMKEEQSALSVKQLTDYLRENEITHLYLAGIYLGQCLSATALDAADKGFRVTVIRDAVMAKNPRKSEKLLRKLEKAGIEII